MHGHIPSASLEAVENIRSRCNPEEDQEPMTGIRNPLVLAVVLASLPVTASAADGTHPTLAQGNAARLTLHKAMPRINKCVEAQDMTCVNRVVWSTYTPARTLLYTAITRLDPTCAAQKPFGTAASNYLAAATISYLTPHSESVARTSLRAWNRFATTYSRVAACPRLH
jgi:hypothetical protein